MSSPGLYLIRNGESPKSQQSGVPTTPLQAKIRGNERTDAISIKFRGGKPEAFI